ncbi:unnamed protein product [Adineta ricciae]|uniref:Uncharacterized protein n=1 Tax=Adineta ricciae TaxID=249248 RepID=A0A814F171_ADIRI|nr:unnamed protein product [Adineta ricciae]CAF1240084.1 unnamed protein product [Adineta ricciae]
MAKLIVAVALFCMVLAAVHGKPPGKPGRDDKGPHGPGPRPSDHDHNDWESKICANASIADAFLNQTRQLITDLTTNGTFTSVLTKQQNEITYINSDDNKAILSSNCTQFFTGLDAARDLDRQAEKQQMELQRTARDLFVQIVKSLLG